MTISIFLSGRAPGDQSYPTIYPSSERASKNSYVKIAGALSVERMPILIGSPLEEANGSGRLAGWLAHLAAEASQPSIYPTGSHPVQQAPPNYMLAATKVGGASKAPDGSTLPI